MNVVLFILAIPFKTNFFMDNIVPMLAVVAVLILILNSILNKLGYTLW